MPSLKERLTKILLDNHLVTSEQLETAVKTQHEKGGDLRTWLVNLGFVSAQNLMSAVSEGLGIPPIKLSRYTVDPEVTKLITGEVARRYKVIPVSRLGNHLTVAMADPLNVFALDSLATVTGGMSIDPIITTAEEIDRAIDQYYGEAVHAAIEEVVKGIERSRVEIVTGKEGREELDASTLLKLTQDAPVVKLTDLLITKAVKLGASDLMIEPLEKTMRVRVRIDGTLREIESPPLSMHAAIVSRIKVISTLDIAERRLPQDGRFRFTVEGRQVDFRVSVVPSASGEKVVLRLLDKRQVKLDINTLGFTETDLERLKAACLRPHGMILACGPTGSGKTTTLYAVLQYVESPEKNLVTVEDPVEFELARINQVSARPEIGLTFSAALRSILRQDPDVIMVGEIRDAETADMAIKSALTGHLVLSTLHTTTAAGATIRLINMGVQPFLINSTVVAIIAQRLIRKLCSSCREAYTLPPAVAEKLQLAHDAKGAALYRSKGCQRCGNTGYRGREIIGEVLIPNNELRTLVLKKARAIQVEEAAHRGGMKTMRENGLAKALAGITSLEEILRTTIGEQLE